MAMKLCPISKCKACGYSLYTEFGGTRVYLGCNKVAPSRAFDFGPTPAEARDHLNGPQTIPDWCPLPDAPEEPKAKCEEAKPE